MPDQPRSLLRPLGAARAHKSTVSRLLSTVRNARRRRRRLQFRQGVLCLDGHALPPAMRQHRRRLLLLGLNLWACSGVMNAASPDVGAHAELLPAEVKLMSNASSCLGAGCSDSSEGAHTRLEPASRRGADELRVFSPGARPALLVGLRPAGNSSTSDDDASQQFFQNSLAPILASSACFLLLMLVVAVAKHRRRAARHMPSLLADAPGVGPAAARCPLTPLLSARRLGSPLPEKGKDCFTSAVLPCRGAVGDVASQAARALARPTLT